MLARYSSWTQWVASVATTDFCGYKTSDKMNWGKCQIRAFLWSPHTAFFPCCSHPPAFARSTSLHSPVQSEFSVHRGCFFFFFFLFWLTESLLKRGCVGSVVAATRLNYLHSLWDLSSLTGDCTSVPWLEGRFSTTGPPGKSLMWSFLWILISCLSLSFLQNWFWKSELIWEVSSLC